VNNLSKFVAGLVGMVLMAIVASWELFMFVVMRDPSGLSAAGGRSHLWWAAITGSIACIAGSLMSYFFVRYEKNKWSKVKMTPTAPLLTTLGGNLFTSVPFDAKRWALAGAWLSEGQADDRTPMDGSVIDSVETESGRRASARRTHQLMFKKWSQARHD
jgi:membrane protein YqaA with SNARE-associated domain